MNYYESVRFFEPKEAVVERIPDGVVVWSAPCKSFVRVREDGELAVVEFGYGDSTTSKEKIEPVQAMHRLWQFVSANGGLSRNALVMNWRDWPGPDNEEIVLIGDDWVYVVEGAAFYKEVSLRDFQLRYVQAGRALCLTEIGLVRCAFSGGFTYLKAFRVR